MARRQTTYTVEGGRDDGKVFVITEMPAATAERFAWKVMCACAAGGLNIPIEALKSGWSGLSQLGPRILTSIPYAELSPLLDEVMQCIAIAPNQNDQSKTRRVDPDDIEEITTLITLRLEAFKLHADFS